MYAPLAWPLRAPLVVCSVVAFGAAVRLRDPRWSGFAAGIALGIACARLLLVRPSNGRACRVDELAQRPEFYNTFTDSCSVNLARHVDRCWPGFVPWRLPVFLPASADRLAFDIGALADDGDFAAIRARLKIDRAIAVAHVGDESSSRAIRGLP